MKRIKLTQGKYAKVSNKDFARVKKYNWHVSESSEGVFYARAWIRGKHVYLHRFIMKPGKGKFAHHRDGRTLNCQRRNLINISESKHRTYVDKKRRKPVEYIPF